MDVAAVLAILSIHLSMCLLYFSAGHILYTTGSHDDAGLPPPGLHLQDGGHHLGRLVRPGPRLAGHLVGGEVVVVQGLVGRL